MLELNNNVKFVDFENFWAGVDEKFLQDFALNFIHSSYTAFKVKFGILLDTNMEKANKVYKEFEQFCKFKDYNINEDFKKKVNELFASQKQGEQTVVPAKEKFSLTKWKSRHRRRASKAREEEHTK